eukprot:6720625-Lingulodinium_polyedra.AAC.1
MGLDYAGPAWASWIGLQLNRPRLDCIGVVWICLDFLGFDQTGLELVVYGMSMWVWTWSGPVGLLNLMAMLELIGLLHWWT